MAVTTAPGGAFEPFDLDILLGGRGEFIVSARSRLGAVFALPVPTPPDFDAEDVATWFDDAIREARREGDEAVRIGGQLRDIAFHCADVRRLFEHTRGAAASERREILLRVLPAPRDIAALPWELLADPAGGEHQFLTLAPDAHVVRAARSRSYPTRTQLLTPPLETLLILSSPMSEDLAFDLDEEKRVLLAELAPLMASGALRVEIEDRPSMPNLRQRMAARGRGYHLVHYLGHADPEALILEDAAGQPERVDPRELTDLLMTSADLHLALFLGCETARNVPGDAGPPGEDGDDPALVQLSESAYAYGSSVADLSVQLSAPYVLGMQALLPFRTERILTRFLYTSLSSGRTLADAVKQARIAVSRDAATGGGQLDWAVPVLFTGDVDPGPIVQEAAELRPRKRRRADLKLGLREGETRFFAQHVAIRQAVDVLRGMSDQRIVVVAGPRGVGKTRFLDRALEDLGDNVEFAIYVQARELIDGDGSAAADAVRELCRCSIEVLARLGWERPPADGQSSRQLWDRLIEELTQRRGVIAIDDIDLTSEHEAVQLAGCVERLARRRGGTRFILSGTELPKPFEDLIGSIETSRVQLEPLSWKDVRRWIRRNVPELSTIDAESLERAHAAGLGDHLERWEQLGRQLVSDPSVGDSSRAAQFERLSAALIRDTQVTTTTTTTATTRPDTRRTATEERQALSPRDLVQIAVAADEHVFAKRELFPIWFTQVATSHDIPGRVVDDLDASVSGAIASLVDVPSPFSSEGTASDMAIARYLDDVAASANIVLLNYGSEDEAIQRGYETLSSLGILLIAAVGNTADDTPHYPAFYDSVLAVGALGADGMPTSYTTWAPDQGKPELFAPVSSTWLSPDMSPFHQREGTSYSSLWVTVVAAMVWATDRSLTAAQIKQVLVSTATRRMVSTAGRKLTRTKPGRRQIKVVNLERALLHVRTDLILRAMQAATAPMSLQEVVAGTGLPLKAATGLLDDLAAKGKGDRIHRMSTHDGDRFVFVPASVAGTSPGDDA